MLIFTILLWLAVPQAVLGDGNKGFLRVGRKRNTENDYNMIEKISEDLPLRSDMRQLQIQPRIVGGRAADLSDYPYFASLKFAAGPVNLGFFGMECGAVLVAPDMLLTAAHCDSNLIRGAYIGPDRLDVDIDQRLKHPNFNGGTMENDFLLLKLKRSVSLTPAVINTDESVPSVNDTLDVVGYGAQQEGGGMSSTFREVQLDFVEHSECARSLGGSVYESTMFCTGAEGGGKDACQGDSGGPLMVGNTVVGLVSFGVGCARENYPGVNARVSAAATWIYEQICCVSAFAESGCTCNGGGGGKGVGLLSDIPGCFSEDTTVDVRAKGIVPMKDLQVGDEVLTAFEAATEKNSGNAYLNYEPVYAFGHHNSALPASFLQIHMESRTSDQRRTRTIKSLEITGNHLIYVRGKSHPVRADSIRVGDALLGRNELHLVVTRIDTVGREGVFAPLTASGNIVVNNNTLASTYVSLRDDAPEYFVGSASLLNISHHDLAHFWMTPLRVLCKSPSSNYAQFGFCQSYSKDGRVKWVLWGMKLAEWLYTLGIRKSDIIFNPAMLKALFGLGVAVRFGSAKSKRA